MSNKTSPDIACPDELIGSRVVIQGASGAGKTFAIRRILEETYGRMQHFVLDVEDEMHTLRERFDYALIGGESADAPITAERDVVLHVPLACESRGNCSFTTGAGGGRVASAALAGSRSVMGRNAYISHGSPCTTTVICFWSCSSCASGSAHSGISVTFIRRG